jgi:hypothetical protein
VADRRGERGRWGGGSGEEEGGGRWDAAALTRGRGGDFNL